MQKHILIFLFLGLIYTYALAQDEVKVTGAGTKEVNGIYKPTHKIQGGIAFSNGKYQLYYKGCVSKWMIQGSGGNYYRNPKDSIVPPKSGWEKGCAKDASDPAPVVEAIGQGNKFEGRGGNRQPKK